MSMVIYKTDFKKGFKINLEWQYVVRNPANIFFKCPMHFWRTILFEASAKHDDIMYQDNMHWIWTIELIKFSPLVMHCGAKAPLQKACLKWILFDIQHILFFFFLLLKFVWSCINLEKCIDRMYSRKAQNPAGYIYFSSAPCMAWRNILFEASTKYD